MAAATATLKLIKSEADYQLEIRPTDAKAD
jgi:hypothetical protein